MSRELLKHKKILEYTSIWMDTIRDGAFGLTNTNRLIRFYSGATGLKTGSTSKAEILHKRNGGARRHAPDRGHNGRSDERRAERGGKNSARLGLCKLFRLQRRRSRCGECPRHGRSERNVRVQIRANSAHFSNRRSAAGLRLKRSFRRSLPRRSPKGSASAGLSINAEMKPSERAEYSPPRASPR